MLLVHSHHVRLTVIRHDKSEIFSSWNYEFYKNMSPFYNSKSRIYGNSVSDLHSYGDQWDFIVGVTKMMSQK